MCVWKSKCITAKLLFSQDRVPDQRQGPVQTRPVLRRARPWSCHRRASLRPDHHPLSNHPGWFSPVQIYGKFL
ncbi:hypothetical protein PR202_gb25810 [Eleusine coracana subsp. coracana]|uniref:Uncharacterized protein n=1 Tax=Eleusine coracana subsp. coracana TaxID=191504 RepID=A0AAV5FQ81_ELECO|nr:hypothetical protein PR202_gb25774 [Eleusine coracana subsp. coracana]GJN36908.1 hypothetical protein PR202_gb25810 [Eleusine coracana subsp. coracana]